MNWIKDNLAIILLAAALVVGYIELRAPQMVESAMDARGLVESGDFESLREDVTEQKVVHKEDRDKLDGKIERIVGILLEE